MLPAPAQGAIGIEIRQSDTECAQAVASLNHAPTQVAIAAERAFLRALDGSCRTPIAALAEMHEGQFYFRGEVLATDGSLRLRCEKRLDGASLQSAAALGQQLGEQIRRDIGDRLLWDEA